MNVPLINPPVFSSGVSLKINSSSAIFQEMLERAQGNHESLLDELLFKSLGFARAAPTHEYLEEFYKVLEHVLNILKDRIFSTYELDGLNRVLRFTPHTLLDKQISLMEYLIHYLFSEPFIRNLKEEVQENQTTRLPAILWNNCLLPAMQRCRILIDISPQENREKYVVLASSLIFRFINFEIIESGYFDHEMDSQNPLHLFGSWRINHNVLDYLETLKQYRSISLEHDSIRKLRESIRRVINKKVSENLIAELGDHYDRLDLLEHNDFSSVLSHSIIEEYPVKLNRFREQFSSTFLKVSGALPGPNEIRGKQREMTRMFWSFFTETFLADALNILGPAPCAFIIVPAGSVGREEVTSLSDLECFIFIEDVSKLEYFKKLARLIELLVISLGETQVENVPNLSTWKEFQPNGFHIDHTTEEGTDESGILILQPSQTDRLIFKQEHAADFTRFENGPLSEYSLLKLPSTLLPANDQLFREYLNSVRSRLRKPLPKPAVHYSTFGERIAYHTIRRRIREYRERTSSSVFIDQIDIKNCLIGPLTHLLTDLHLYFCDSTTSIAQSPPEEVESHPLTNTLDIIEDLREIFDLESQELLKHCVSELYLIRVRLHDAYGPDHGHKKDLACIDHSDLKIKRLFEGEKEIVNRTRWLVLYPLYDYVEEVMKNQVPFKEAMRDISLKNLVLTDIDKKLLLIKDVQEKIDLDEDLPIIMKEKLKKDKRESYQKLVEVSRELSRYLLDTGTPIELHEFIYRRFSSDPKFEKLRFAYLQRIEGSLLHTHLVPIPNLDGTRQSTRLDEEKFATHLIKIVQRHPTNGSVTCKVVSPTLTEDFYLTQEVINSILTSDGQIKKEIAETDRNVCRFYNGIVDFYFKQKPFQPLAEYAFYAFLSRILGKGSPVTELARFEVTVSGKKIVYPVLISETIQGINLKDALPRYPFPIDRTHLTLMLLCILLIRSGDGRAPNHILTLLNQIFCVDSDISFVEPIVKSHLGETGKRLGMRLGRQLNFCSILFCLNEQLDQESLRQFATLDASSILTAWLKDIEKKEKSYLALFTEEERKFFYTRDPRQTFTPTLILSKGELSKLFLQFRHLQEYIRQTLDIPLPTSYRNSSYPLSSNRTSEKKDLRGVDDLDFVLLDVTPERSNQPSSSSSKNITSLDLLEQMITLVGKDLEMSHIGHHLRAAYSLGIKDNPETRLNKATNVALRKTMTSSAAYKASLGRFPTIEELETKERPISQAKAELALYTFPYQKAWARIGKGIVELNFTEWAGDLKKQEAVLTNLLKIFNEQKEKPTTIVLTYCEVLTDEILPSFLHHQLEVLNLTGCSRITNTSSIAALSPNLRRLHLSRCSSLKLFVGLGNRVASFADLEELRIERCPELSKIALQAYFLKNLKAHDNPKLGELNLDLTFPITEVSVHNCPLLDPNWNQITRQLIKVNLKIHLNWSGIDDEILLRLIENDPTLTVLDLSSKEIDDAGATSLATALRNNFHLTTLNLTKNQIGDKGAAALAAILTQQSKLAVLYFCNNQIGDAGASALAIALETNSSVTELSLSMNQIGDGGTIALARALEHNSTLHKLYLRRNLINDSGASALITALGHNSTLIELRLDDNEISETTAMTLENAIFYRSLEKEFKQSRFSTSLVDEKDVDFFYMAFVQGLERRALENNTSVAQLCRSDDEIEESAPASYHKLTKTVFYRDLLMEAYAKVIEQNTTITELYLSLEQISDVGATALATALRQNTTLTKLRLKHNQIGIKGAIALATALGPNSTLSNLNLGHNQIGNEGAIAVIAALAENSTLTLLYLQRNQIDDEGAIALASAIEQNSTLISLDLRCNEISDVGATALITAYEQHSSLLSLRLGGNQISEAIRSRKKKSAHYKRMKRTFEYGLTKFGMNTDEVNNVYVSYVEAAERTALEQNTSVIKMLEDGEDKDWEKLSVIDALPTHVLFKLLKKKLEKQFKANSDKEIKNNLDVFYEFFILELIRTNLKSSLKGSFLTEFGLSESEIKDFWSAFETVLEEKALEQDVSVKNLILDDNNDQDFWDTLIFEGLLRFLIQNSSLTKLVLNNKKIDDKKAVALATALKQHSPLTELYLRDNRISGVGIASLATALALHQKRTLTVLDLTNNQIGGTVNSTSFDFDLSDHGICTLAYTFLRGNVTLTELRLGNNQIGDSGARALANALQHGAPYLLAKINTLTLDLSNNQIGNAGATEFAKKISSLKKLDLSNNRICDNGLIVLGVSLFDNSSLTVLDLSNNEITDEGVRSITMALHMNETLTVLKLRNNKISLQGLQKFLNALQKNNFTLIELDLSGNEYLRKNVDFDSSIKELLERNKRLREEKAFLRTESLEMKPIHKTVKQINSPATEIVTVSHLKTVEPAQHISGSPTDDKLRGIVLNQNPSDSVARTSVSNQVETNITASTSSLYDELNLIPIGSSENAVTFTYDTISYQRQYLTRADGACAIHALLGTRIGGEYVWNPKKLDLDRTAKVQRKAKTTFIKTIRPILASDQSHHRILLHQSMEERLAEAAEFKEWNIPFEVQFISIQNELSTHLNPEFYERIKEKFAPIFQNTLEEYLKLLERLENSQDICGSLSNCIDANFRELKEMNLADPTWQRILELRERKAALEHAREQALHVFIDAHFELYSKIIAGANCYLSVDELKLAAELLTPKTKVMIFYNKDALPHIINPDGIGEAIAIEHSIVYHPNGRHFSRLEPVKSP